MFGKKRSKSLEDLQRFTFVCGCKVYSDIDFKKQNFVIECSKHMRQLYDLTYYRKSQENMNEFFEPEQTIDYYIMRECKTCHIYIDSLIEKLDSHLHSNRHRETLDNVSQRSLT